MSNGSNGSSAGVSKVDNTNVDPSSSSSYGLSAWKKQLITKEDPTHVHKALGILCMISYIFRIVQTGPSDMGFQTMPYLTLPTIILHLLLNSTSFIFKIPNRRISSGYRIWPEYRLHSLVFLCRSLAVMTLYYYEQTFHVEQPMYDMNLVIIILGLFAADYASFTQRQYQSSTIRDLDTSELVKFAFSVAQFCGTANILYGLRYRYSLHMLAVIVIQTNAFMMTVRRKNLASQTTLVTLYGLSLLMSMMVCSYEYIRTDPKIFFTCATISNIAIVQRMTPIHLWPSLLQPIQSYVGNKYVVWMTVGLLLRQTRTYIETTATLHEMVLIWIVTSIPLYMLGWYKCSGQSKINKNNVTIKKVE
jgi:hypothetical protein